MIVPYSQMMSFIVSGYRPLNMHFFNRELTFTFDHYVKSQLHLNVVSDLYGRDIFKYNGALKYLRGDDSRLLDCSEVLRYFYVDMTNMLCTVLRFNPKMDCKINIQSSFNRTIKLPKKSVDLSEVVDDLSLVLSGDVESKSSSIRVYSEGVLVKFKYEDLDRLVANELLALAAIFNYYGNSSEETYVVEVRS